jgi:hypothetical protein
MPDDPVSDEILARHQMTQDDAKCSCKAGPVAVQKSAAHRDQNTGTREPAVPQGRKLDLANATAVPADSPAAGIKNGAEALAAHRAYLEAQAAGTAGGGAAGGASGPGAELGVTYRGTAGAPSQYVNAPGLAAHDAGRGSRGYTPQANPRGGRR